MPEEACFNYTRKQSARIVDISNNGSSSHSFAAMAKMHERRKTEGSDAKLRNVIPFAHFLLDLIKGLARSFPLLKITSDGGPLAACLAEQTI